MVSYFLLVMTFHVAQPEMICDGRDHYQKSSAALLTELMLERICYSLKIKMLEIKVGSYNRLNGHGPS